MPESYERSSDAAGVIAVGLDREIRRLVERTTAAQGLPFHVKDKAILARVAALVRAVNGKDELRRAS